jgi:hypothetical protein
MKALAPISTHFRPVTFLQRRRGRRGSLEQPDQ